MQEHYLVEAHKEWDHARRKAFWAGMLGGLRGKRLTLLSFSEISHRLHLENAMYRGLQSVPLDQIQGSEDRYGDFSRAFLPLVEDMGARWQRIASLYLDPMSGGVPPVELYKVGGVYFVKDGNHRVSVARQLMMDEVEAYVWEFELPQLGADADVDTLLREAERQDFLRQTHLDALRPEHKMRLTAPGGYLDMLRQIAHYQDALRQIDGVPVAYETAVTAWYDMIYETTVQTIEDSGIMSYFPERTATDLFVWISRRRAVLENQYGAHVKVKDTVQDLRARMESGPLARLWRRFRGFPRTWGGLSPRS